MKEISIERLNGVGDEGKRVHFAISNDSSGGSNDLKTELRYKDEKMIKLEQEIMNLKYQLDTKGVREKRLFAYI